MDRGAWRRLTLVAVAVLYVATLAWHIQLGGVLNYVGGDFRSFVASAQIVRDHGFAAVYNLSLQARYQSAILPPRNNPEPTPLQPVPTPYLPPFVALFTPILLFEPVVSWWLWTLLNTLALLVYLHRLIRLAGARPEVILTSALCLPAFLNLFFGQVNVWLLVCFGESLIALRRRQDLRAGLWLAGLLIKPQTLVLLIPALALGRQHRPLIGSALGALGIALLSIGLAGLDGMGALFQLMLGYASPQGLPSNVPYAMMNWRALASNLDAVLPSPFWTILALACSLVTGMVAIGLWLSRPAPTSVQYAQYWLGMYAATCLVAWHSHAHMALPIIAPAIFVWGDAYTRSRAYSLWLFVPIAVYLGLVYVYAPVMAIFGLGQWVSPAQLDTATGLSVFATNLFLFVNVLASPVWQKATAEQVRP